MTKAIVVRIEGDYVITAQGADLLSAIAGQASDARDEAVSAAAVALAAGGVGEYPDTGAGLSGTTEGETFWVDLGDGTGRVYRHDPGPTATPLQKFIIDPTVSGAADIFAGGVPTTAALASSTGGGMVGTKYDEAGSRLRTFAEVAVKRVELSGFTGADPSMATDSYAALQNGIAAAVARKGELVIDGSYRVSLAGHGPLNITAPITIKGAQHRVSNVPIYEAHQAAIYIDDDPASAITVDNGGQLTLDSMALIGPSTASNGAGIRNIHENSATVLRNGAVIQGFHIGWKVESGYYHRIDDATIADCILSIAVSGPGFPPIYNFVASQLKLAARDAAGSVGISVVGNSQVSLNQCGIENCHADGIQVSNASLLVEGSYFENFGGWNIHTFDGAKVLLLGNRVYLDTGCPRWVSNDGASTAGVEVIGHGNIFKVPTDATAADIYRLNSDDDLAVTELSGDIYYGAPGGNVRYLEAGFIPKALKGQHNIRFPAGHARQNQPISTLPIYMPPSQSGVAAALEGMVVNYGCNGFAGDDPGGWRLDGWGANPMQMVFHKSTAVPDGQWEKIGLRLPYIAAPSGGATQDAEARAWISALMTALNAQGVMHSS